MCWTCVVARENPSDIHVAEFWQTAKNDAELHFDQISFWFVCFFLPISCVDISTYINIFQPPKQGTNV